MSKGLCEVKVDATIVAALDNNIYGTLRDGRENSVKERNSGQQV
jgi:hypothetical protein